jgi:hypothetical protein
VVVREVALEISCLPFLEVVNPRLAVKEGEAQGEVEEELEG